MDGATGYQVWFLNAPAAGRRSRPSPTSPTSASTTCRARHPPAPSSGASAPSASRTAAAKNGLPAASYGPWSPVFRSAAPAQAPAVAGPPRQGGVGRRLDPGHPKPHTLVPALTVNGAPTTPEGLYRVYVFTDRDCVNRVFTGYPVSSPAYAPRSNGGQALPEGKQLMADGTEVKPTELVHVGTGPAKIDLWDTTGRYYAVAVPVVAHGGSALPQERPQQVTTTQTTRGRHDAGGTTHGGQHDADRRRRRARSPTRTPSSRRTSARRAASSPSPRPAGRRRPRAAATRPRRASRRTGGSSRP